MGIKRHVEKLRHILLVMQGTTSTVKILAIIFAITPSIKITNFHKLNVVKVSQDCAQARAGTRAKF